MRSRLVLVLMAMLLSSYAVGSPASNAATSLTPSIKPLLTTPSPAEPSPTKPLAKKKPAIPPLSAAQKAVGFVDVRTVVPDAVLDLRYATTNNFTHVRLYPLNARCLVHQSMTAGLRTAAAKLRAKGYLLVFWDCYRPHSVQKRMWQVVPNPNWVAAPGPYSYSHETGRSVDVTLETVTSHRLLDMGTGFDDFTAKANAYATAGLTAAEQANRARLRSAMESGGLAPYSGEWWHFDGPGASVKRPIINVPVN